ncbi:exo-alpha-sialidase [Steroidobacter sp. S1-65]|uniref:Exo-alpha-sialidase n=1 Tax=Steroidobacter gossypii TaxID=2805490 RepID=A0ABS1X4W3_9GAMM|nr:sialidase family protein [Steroidobacter gossypii]MBM0108259.1 exo-alpha-sialidase [Steroidobacter gossypii]
MIRSTHRYGRRTLPVFLCLVLTLLTQPVLAAMSHGRALGTTAAFDHQKRLWVVRTEPVDKNAHVILQRSDDEGATWQPAIRVTSKPEPVSADGENRPKLAFGPRNEIYVTWTSPTSQRFTGDIRFTRSLDGGKSWSAPSVIHRDRQLITHRFESMLVDGAGRVWVAWIDKRDLGAAQAAKQDYAGAAVYYAYSDDQGATWRGDYKLVDHSCECCRIALALNAKGRATAMWRHVFPPNERDHAFAVLQPDGKNIVVERATTDRWRIDACPHHGPSLAFAPNGARHAVWFNQVKGEGRAFYGRLTGSDPEGVQALPAGAVHADIAVRGSTVAIAWKRFDGTATRVESWLSNDGGRSFTAGPSLQTQGESDQPRMLSNDSSMLIVWRTADGIEVARLGDAKRDDAIKPFSRDTLSKIEQRHAGSEFWVVLWDLECVYCMKSLSNLAAVQKQRPALKIVTIATDSITAQSELRERLEELGVQSEAYAFAAAPEEALRFAIDPKWMGEKPRAYRYATDGSRIALSGVLTAKELAGS